jgi:hypothetical protein
MSFRRSSEGVRKQANHSGTWTCLNRQADGGDAAGISGFVANESAIA